MAVVWLSAAYNDSSAVVSNYLNLKQQDINTARPPISLPTLFHRRRSGGESLNSICCIRIYLLVSCFVHRAREVSASLRRNLEPTDF